MKAANERRIISANNIFAAISGLLVVIHAFIIWVGFELAREEDDFDPQMHKVPDAVAFAICGLLQLVSAVLILINNAHPKTTKSIYYASIIGMASVFASGVSYSINASQFNSLTRNYPRTEDPLPKMIWMYWSFQIGAFLLFILAFPMFLFVFYHKLEKYIELQRQEREENKSDSTLQCWCLGLFLLQVVSNITNIVNLYQYSDAQDSKDYNTQNSIDIYVFYFAVAAVVCGAAVILQIKNNHTRFLSKKQTILLAVLVCLFQVGVLLLVAIKVAQTFVVKYVLGDQYCNLQKNCDAANLWLWEYVGHTAFVLICVLLQFPFLKQVTNSKDPYDQRQTLMTTTDAIDS